ncbi:hypothetical protein [Limosilactobacillus fermentum]|uniref:hypothetical protein n=1 Tax=Limosilactobacillus fermentum TaxID=1613 RepID=UPI000E47992E|nr:hypothetical protein [Limosilactobacillus fermentum]MCH5383745.1 hypothetical protein [Limosilactobacillus fermentum]RGU85209.1 hypothetical protein DWW42_07390 [Limosilactobacillus fermentum]
MFIIRGIRRTFGVFDWKYRVGNWLLGLVLWYVLRQASYSGNGGQDYWDHWWLFRYGTITYPIAKAGWDALRYTLFPEVDHPQTVILWAPMMCLWGLWKAAKHIMLFMWSFYIAPVALVVLFFTGRRLERSQM